MWSTPAVWKQYNKMAVLHLFLVNSPLIYILFSLYNYNRKRLYYNYNRKNIIIVISSDRPCKDGTAWFTTVPLSLTLIKKFWLGKFQNNFSIFSYLKKIRRRLMQRNVKWTDKKTFENLSGQSWCFHLCMESHLEELSFATNPIF